MQHSSWQARSLVLMRWACVLVVLVAAAGCSRVPPLSSTHASPEAVARAVLDALGRSDRTALQALAINEQEFRDHVWEWLPAARPERNLPFSYVWGDHRQKSDGMLSRALERHGGRRYELLSVEFDGVSDFGPYAIHRAARVEVRDTAGEIHTLRVCGSMLEQDGRWKVFSYIVDDDD